MERRVHDPRMTAEDPTIAEPRRGPVTRSAVRPFAIWFLLIAVGLLLLYLRYDWDVGDGHYAKRAFVLSAYLFALTLPTSFYLGRWLLRDARAAGVVTGVIFVVTTLPWKLLGLDALGYYNDRPRAFNIGQVPRPPALEFLPGGTFRTFPYDFLFMPALLASGLALIWAVWWIRKRSGASAPRAVAVLLSLAFVAICAQTYVHSSMRAPYTYLALFQRKEAKQHWYHVYHFRDGTGASEADQFVFTALEEYFQGARADGNNMLARRPYSFYAVSQASFFINTFYVWLGLNCLFWLAAVAATGRWVTRVATPRAGLIAAGLVTFSPGFVAFAATTGMYMQAFAVVMIAVCLFEELIVRSARRRGDFALFAAAFAVSMLVYDLLPLAVSLIVYGLARRVRAGPLLLSIGAAVVVSYAFPLLLTVVLSTAIDDTNSRQLTFGLRGVKRLIVHPRLEAWYHNTTDLLPTYVGQLLQAFFVLPTLLALVGLLRLKDRALLWFVGSLLVTGFGVVAVLVLGNQLVGRAPRIVFPVLPAVYLLAAMTLDSFRLPGRFRMAAPWIAIGVMAVLVNFDIFGYPTLYVEYFTGGPPVFLP